MLSQYMTEHPRAVYNDVKNILRNEFCVDDYKRALESKLRCTKFTRSTDISTFCPQLKQIIQEKYNVVEPDNVELIAVNHIIYHRCRQHSTLLLLYQIMFRNKIVSMV